MSSASAEQPGILLERQVGIYHRAVGVETQRPPIRLAPKPCAALYLNILDFFLQPLEEVLRRVPPVAKFTAVWSASISLAAQLHIARPSYLSQY